VRSGTASLHSTPQNRFQIYAKKVYDTIRMHWFMPRSCVCVQTITLDEYFEEQLTKHCRSSDFHFDYQLDLWWWELLEQIRKLLMTSCMVSVYMAVFMYECKRTCIFELVRFEKTRTYIHEQKHAECLCAMPCFKRTTTHFGFVQTFLRILA
jgi:hypothetical protein